ncbi:MAG: DoxX family protein, partial [Deltaproteobacteria bacterium]
MSQPPLVGGSPTSRPAVLPVRSFAVVTADRLDCPGDHMLTSIKTLPRRALEICNQLGWIGPLLVRLIVGIAFVLTGWGKLHSLDNVTEFFTDLGIPLPHANAVFVSTVEFVGGLLLILGLGTRIAAALLIGVMTVALLTAIGPKADSALDLFSTIELTYLVVFVWLLVNGG